MTLDMPRPRPPYLHRYVTRHGRVNWYVRKPGCKRVRIRAEYGTPEFDEAYHRAIDGLEPLKATKAATGSLQWLWERYRETGAWTGLAGATRRQRENIMAGVLKTGGAAPYSAITRGTIAQGRDRRSATPAQSINFLKLMRGLFKWAAQADHVAADPAKDVEMPKVARSEGFIVWTEDDIDNYYERWPLGTRQRVWLDVLLYTGLRRGDAVRLGRQHVRDGVAVLRTEKSGNMIEVAIPVLPVLAITLAAGPCGDLAFICGERGGPLTKESFGNMFKDACVAAGVSQKKKAAHGLRKIGATRAADNGATEHQLMAIFGWTDLKMPMHYTKSANRRRLSKAAMGKLERDPICQPRSKVGTSDE